MKSTTQTGGNFEFFYSNNDLLEDTQATAEFKKRYALWVRASFIERIFIKLSWKFNDFKERWFK